jgi:RND family efflux transporter MFP subunit
MVTIIVAAWTGLLFLLVKLGVLKGWTTWMKASPVVLFLLCEIILFLPMNFGAPSGRALVYRNSVPITPSVSGVVTEVPVASGVALAKGDVLFRIDPVPFQAEVDQLAAQLVLARQELDRSMELVASRVASEKQGETAKARFDQLEARLTAARWKLDHATVRAPSNGFVTSVVLQPGARVSANTSAVMGFVTEGAQSVAVQIEQIHLRHVAVGQAAEVIFKLYPRRVFSAKVEQILRAGASGLLTASGTVPETPEIESEPFWVVVELDDTSVELPAGAAGTAAIFTDELGHVHVFRKLILRMENWLNYLKPSF